MKKSWIISITIVFMSTALYAEDGVAPDKILLGQSCALNGPAEALGKGMRAGLLACFSKINKEGGVNGRQIELVSKDDGYEPILAIRNTKQLIEKDKVFLLIGEVGTPTSKAVVPIAEKTKIPFFCPFTGAEFLRNPFRKYVVNVRAGYYQEMEKLAEYLVDKKKIDNIACFYQNDGYGQAGLKGIEIALGKRSLKLSAAGKYERNTTAVKSGLLNIRRAQPGAVVMVGAYKPCAEFIRLAGKVGMKDVIFCNISFVGTKALVDELGEAGEGCIISQVVPFPWDENFSLVKEHNAAMKASQPNIKAGFVTLEGFMAGKLFAMAAGQVDGDLTRESIIKTIGRVKTFDLGGVTLNYGPEDHQGMDDVLLTVIRDGKIMLLED